MIMGESVKNPGAFYGSCLIFFFKFGGGGRGKRLMFFLGGWNFQNLFFFEEEFDFGKRWERRQKELCVFHYLICMAWGVFFHSTKSEYTNLFTTGLARLARQGMECLHTP